MTKKIFRFLGIGVLLYVLICLMTPFNTFLRNRSIKNQINYLSKIIDAGYDDQLQKRFPEGKLFSNALLALSTIEFCDKQRIVSQEYSYIVDSCIRRIQSSRARSTFDADMIPRYGMFYCGWSNLIYTSYINSPLFSKSKLKSEVEEESEKISLAISETLLDSIRILNSYKGSNWPADNFIGIISVKHDSLKLDWIDRLFQTAEHTSGLIHHSGSNKMNIRGSSSAMITYCLKKAHYPDIEKYNQTYKDIFVHSFFGIQLVKENEDGSNRMDVDSGPVLFGYGASATIMNIKTQASLSSNNSKITWAALNLISVPINMFYQKYYILKKEPMLDLFMLWGCTEF